MPERNHSSFALRLPRSTRFQANEIAKAEGISLNQFITLAVAEKITRLQAISMEAEKGIDWSDGFSAISRV